MTFDEIQLKAFSLTEAEMSILQKQMIAEYDTALKAIKKDIKKIYNTILDNVKPENYYANMVKYNRLVKLQESIVGQYVIAAKKVKDLMIANSELAISNIYYRHFYSINWTQINTVFVALHPAVIEASVFSTSKIWDELRKETQKKLLDVFGNPTNYYPQSGTLLNELLKKKNADTLANLEIALRQGLIQGKSFQQTAGMVRDVMGNDINKALRIAITEGHRNMTTGNYAMMEAAKSEGVEARRKIVSVFDMRTRQQSATVNGRFENDEGLFEYPRGVMVRIPGNSGVAAWDIRDREAVVMVVDGFDSDLIRARDPVKEDNWNNATAAERKAGETIDGVKLYPRSKQTDLISYTSFDDWMKSNNLVYDKYGKMQIKK